MHWSLDDLLALPTEYYDALLKLAPDWLKAPRADDTTDIEMN